MTYNAHTQHVYGVEWNPFAENSFASVSKDATLRIWDTRQEKHTSMTKSPLPGNYLTCVSWSQKTENMVGVGKKLKKMINKNEKQK